MAQVISQAGQQKPKKDFLPIYDQKEFTPKKLDFFQLDGLNDDVGKFSEAMANFGLIAGQLLLITFGALKKSIIVKVESFNGNQIKYAGQTQSSQNLLIGPKDSIEILQRGQKYGVIELQLHTDGTWYGKSEEQLKPHLGRLLAGLPVKGEWTRPDGSNFYGEVRLIKDEGSKSRKLLVQTNERREKLERTDYKLGVTITDSMWEQMLATPNVGIRVDFNFVNKNNQQVNLPGRLYIDPNMNQVKYRFLDQSELKQEIKEKELDRQGTSVDAKLSTADSSGATLVTLAINAVKDLKNRGFKDTWFDVKHPDKGIILDTKAAKKDGITASIKFDRSSGEVLQPRLEISTSSNAIIIPAEVKSKHEMQLKIVEAFIQNDMSQGDNLKKKAKGEKNDLNKQQGNHQRIS